MSFLISAIALAGLSPFGQVTAQFMIVWQGSAELLLVFEAPPTESLADKKV